MVFKDRLKEKRVEAGLTQAELAQKAGVTTRTCNLRSATATGAVVNGHSAERQRPA